MKTPRPYQQYAIDRAARQNVLIADACGLGKTLQAIETIKRVQPRIEKPALVVAPSATVKLQWYNALIEQGICAERILWLDSSTKKVPEKIAAIEPAQLVILTHYEAVRKHAPTLQPLFFSVVVADEAHRIKNRKALRTTALKAIQAYRKIALTGTPYDRDPSDIWSILQWLDPDFFRSYWRFFDAHINYQQVTVKRGVTVKQILASPLRDAESFARTLWPYMIQRRKDDVRDDLPPRIDQFIDLEMSSAQARAYQTIAEAEDPIVELAEGLETSVSIVLTQILRLIQITTDPGLLGLTDVSSVKLDWLADWLEDNPNESVIIFTRFRATAEKLHAQLGDRFKLIVGGKRAQITSADRYIVGTISAMGEGLDLPHIDNAIFIDVEWSSIMMQQAIDRIHRINITNAKNVYYLRCAGTVDHLLHTALRQKWSTKEIAEAYLNGRADAEPAT